MDCLFTSHELDELFDYYLNLDAPLSPLFMRDTDFNFSSPIVKAPSVVQPSPLPFVSSPPLQITPLPLLNRGHKRSK